MIDRLDDVSDSIARAFAEISRARMEDHPRLIYPLLTTLLEDIGDFPMALDVQSALALLNERLGKKACEIIQDSAEQVSGTFRQLVHPTYTAVSYWGPWDRRRHTIAHRQQPRSELEKRQCLVCANAFYDLTLNGPPHYYSVVHYISERAARKRPLNVCYRRDLPKTSATSLWHIPPTVAEDILDATLLRAFVDEKINQWGRRSEDALVHALQSLLENKEGKLLLPWTFADPIIKSFATVVREFSPFLKMAIEKHQAFINARIAEQNSTSESVSFAQAAFMLMTHALYREACPAEFVYMFLVRVPGTCCVMTIGTDEPLLLESQLALSAFVRTLFYQPLLLEYAAIEANAQLEVEENKARLERALTEGHNFGGPIRSAETALDSVKRRLPSHVHDDVLSDISDLSKAIERMKDIKYGLKRLAPYNLRERQLFPLAGTLETIATEARSMGFDCHVAIDKSFVIVGDPLALTDCFRELLKNADRWVDRRFRRQLTMTASVADKRTLSRDLDSSFEYVRTEFRDNGPGIPYEQREEIFKPFVTRHAKGLGLGLSMALRKINAHGGTLAVIGPPEDGACFEIILPLAGHQTNVVKIWPDA